MSELKLKVKPKPGDREPTEEDYEESSEEKTDDGEFGARRKLVKLKFTFDFGVLCSLQMIVRLHIKSRPKILAAASKLNMSASFDLINDHVHCLLARHNQLPHDRKDSNNLRHADRNLAQNEVSLTHQIHFNYN